MHVLEGRRGGIQALCLRSLRIGDTKFGLGLNFKYRLVTKSKLASLNADVDDSLRLRQCRPHRSDRVDDTKTWWDSSVSFFHPYWLSQTTLNPPHAVSKWALDDRRAEYLAAAYVLPPHQLQLGHWIYPFQDIGETLTSTASVFIVVLGRVNCTFGVC